MSFINWGNETHSQIESRRRAELEWQALMEKAMNMRRQQSIQVAGVAGSSKPQITQNDLTAALYPSDGGTWRFTIYSANKNEILVDHDTEISTQEYQPYSLNNLSPIVPVQQKGFFFILGKDLGNDAVDAKMFCFDPKGELKDFVEQALNPNEDFGVPAVCDGFGIVIPVAPAFELTPGLTKIFDGDQVTDYVVEAPGENQASILFSGSFAWSNSIDNGSIVLIAFTLSLGSPTVLQQADLFVVDSTKSLKKVQTLEFGPNFGPVFAGWQWKGNTLYVIYADDDDYPLRLTATKIDGTPIADIDLTAVGVGFEQLGPGTAIPYSDNSAQFVFTFLNESEEMGWLLYNFDGAKGTYQTYTIEPGEFEALQVQANSHERGDLVPYSKSAGILNIFYTVTNYPEIDRATFLYKLDEESAYRRYDFKVDGDDPKAVLFNTESLVENGVFGAVIGVAVDLGSPSGLTGDLTILFLDKEVKIVDGNLNYLNNFDEVVQVACGDYSIVKISYQDFTIREALYVYDKQGNLLDQLVDAEYSFDGVVTSYDSIFVRKANGDSYYFNRDSNQFELLPEQYPNAESTADQLNNQWLTPNNRENGLIIISRPSANPGYTNCRAITKRGIGPEIEVLGTDGVGILPDFIGSASFGVDSLTNYAYTFDGELLNTFVYPYSPGEIDPNSVILNKSNQFLWDTNENNLLFLNKNSLFVNQVAIDGTPLISAVNDWVWYWNSSYDPTPPPSSGTINITDVRFDIVGNSDIDFNWDGLRTNSDTFFIAIADNQGDVFTDPIYTNNSNPVNAPGGSTTLPVTTLNGYELKWIGVAAYDINGDLVTDTHQIPSQQLPSINLTGAMSFLTGAILNFTLTDGNSQILGQNIVAEYSFDGFLTTIYTSSPIVSLVDGTYSQSFDQPAGPLSLEVRLRLEIPGALNGSNQQQYWYSKSVPISIL